VFQRDIEVDSVKFAASLKKKHIINIKFYYKFEKNVVLEICSWDYATYRNMILNILNSVWRTEAISN
jgi:hypothetical protein